MKQKSEQQLDLEQEASNRLDSYGAMGSMRGRGLNGQGRGFGCIWNADNFLWDDNELPPLKKDSLLWIESTVWKLLYWSAYILSHLRQNYNVDSWISKLKATIHGDLKICIICISQSAQSMCDHVAKWQTRRVIVRKVRGSTPYRKSRRTCRCI